MTTPVRLAALLLPLAVLAGCSSDGGTDTAAGGAESVATADGSDGAAGSDGLCATTDAELIAADATPGEPTVQIPQPDGWEPSREMNSDIIRLVLSNQGITRDGFAPNVVLTAEPSSADAQAEFDRQLAGLEEMVDPADVETETGTVCGYESMTVDYLLPPMAGAPERPAKAQIIVVPNGDAAITYAITAQATTPTDPSYDRDLETILTGVQISD